MIKLMIAFFCFIFFLSNGFTSSELQVGIAARDLTPETSEHIPLGGYGGTGRRILPFQFFTIRPYLRGFRVSEGVIDPIRAKVMYLKVKQQRLLLMSLDLVGVTKDFHSDLVKKLQDQGFQASELLISGTHTHSGPGALSRNPFWQALAMDRFQRKFYDKFLDQIADTAREAVARAEPAELHSLSFQTHKLQRNRRGADRPLDPKANLLLARSSSGSWLGGMVNFAVHGTWFGEENLKFSSDVPGAIEKSLSEFLYEENGYVRSRSTPEFVFINGAEGDVLPAQEYRELGKLFALQARENWANLRQLDTADLEVTQKEISLGLPKINISKCVEKKWLPQNFRLGVKRFISPTTLITQVKLGGLMFLTWPGEPTTELGLQLVAAAKETGVEDAWVLALTNDHLSYFVTAEEFEKGGYEACSNFFGAQGGRKVIEAHKDLWR
jgi:hypothetical protein